MMGQMHVLRLSKWATMIGSSHLNFMVRQTQWKEEFGRHHFKNEGVFF